MSEYFCHKAVELAKVVKSKQKPLEQLAQEYEAQHKYDGCWVAVDVSEARSWSRTGEEVRSLGAIQRELANIRHLNGMVVIGEAWAPGVPFNEISGEYRRHYESDRLLLVVNDVLTRKEFVEAHSPVPYVERIKRLGLLPQTDRLRETVRYNPGTYGDPQALCNRLVDLGGFDGVILRDPQGTWTAGRGTTGEIIKIKRKLSFDLRVTERHHAVGEKTGRNVYTITVDFKGKPLRVGSGIPHQLRAVPVPGQIVEIEAMDYSADGLLREPRFKGIRHDKLEPDD